jgi:Holliday junction resolvase RusA-like endonuclease
MNHLISSHLDAKIDPMAKPRMTRADKYLKRLPVIKYRAFKDELTLIAQRQRFVLGERFVVVFELPMAPSWSKKKRQLHLGKPHKSLKDLDNLTKSICDCLLPEQDSAVNCFFAAKFWGEFGRIRIYNVHQTKENTVDALIKAIESENSSLDQDWF